jgi:hypothetical protein
LRRGLLLFSELCEFEVSAICVGTGLTSVTRQVICPIRHKYSRPFRPCGLVGASPSAEVGMTWFNGLRIFAMTYIHAVLEFGWN